MGDVLNTLGLSPCCVDTLEAVALVAHEALGACNLTISVYCVFVGVFSCIVEVVEVRRMLKFEGQSGWERVRTLLDDRYVLLSGNHLDRKVSNVFKCKITIFEVAAHFVDLLLDTGWFG